MSSDCESFFSDWCIDLKKRRRREMFIGNPVNLYMIQQQLAILLSYG